MPASRSHPTRHAGGRARRRVAAVLTAGALLATAACGDSGGSGGSTSSGASPAADPSVSGYHGVEPNPRPARPSFVLRDTAGNLFDFKARTSGRITLMYFGYTNCPDECITAMADVAAAVRRAPKDIKERLDVVFVATDPARDTPAVLRRWLDQFSTEFIGLVGNLAEVEAAQRAAGLRVAAKEGPVPTLPGRPNEHVHKAGTAPHTHFGPLGYSVGHTNVIFGYDVSDRLPVVYPGGSTPADIAADLPLLARPGS